MTYTYDDDIKEGYRWLILSDLEQDFPKGPLRVIESAERKTKAGKGMPVLVLEHAIEGEKYQICAWKRDVLKCIKEYGVNPEQWGCVEFKKEGNTMVLVPSLLQIDEERV